MNGMSETNKVVLAAVLGIIIGFGFGRFSPNRQVGTADSNQPLTASTTEESGTSTVPGAVMATSTSGSVASPVSETQEPAAAKPEMAVTPVMPGKRVTQQTSKTSAVSAIGQTAGYSVSTLVSTDRLGWVAVHEQTNGKPGRILGAKHFGPGTATVVVPLKRATLSGGTYYVMLHGDDGDISDFTTTRDLPLLGANGLPIMVAFKTL